MAEGVVHRMVKRAVEMEGTVTGEHGVGLIKRDYLEHELGESTVDAMRKVRFTPATSYINSDCVLTPLSSLQLKQAFDPLSLLNADKVVRVEYPSPGEIKKW